MKEECFAALTVLRQKMLPSHTPASQRMSWLVCTCQTPSEIPGGVYKNCILLIFIEKYIQEIVMKFFNYNSSSL